MSDFTTAAPLDGTLAHVLLESALALVDLSLADPKRCDNALTFLLFRALLAEEYVREPCDPARVFAVL